MQEKLEKFILWMGALILMAHNKKNHIQMNKMESQYEIIFEYLHQVNWATKLWSHYILLLWEKKCSFGKNRQKCTKENSSFLFTCWCKSYFNWMKSTNYCFVDNRCTYWIAVYILPFSQRSMYIKYTWVNFWQYFSHYF